MRLTSIRLTLTLLRISVEIQKPGRRKDRHALSIFQRIVNSISCDEGTYLPGNGNLEESLIVRIWQVMLERRTRNKSGLLLYNVKECVDMFFGEGKLGTVKNLSIF